MRSHGLHLFAYLLVVPLCVNECCDSFYYVTQCSVQGWVIEVKESVHQINKIIFSHVHLVISVHADSFDIIFPSFEISVSEVSAFKQIQGR